MAVQESLLEKEVEESPKVFYARFGTGWVEVPSAKRAHLDLPSLKGRDFYVHRDIEDASGKLGNEWTVSDAETGLTLGVHSGSEQWAIEDTTKRLKSVTAEYFQSVVDRAIQNSGRSPAYRKVLTPDQPHNIMAFRRIACNVHSKLYLS